MLQPHVSLIWIGSHQIRSASETAQVQLKPRLLESQAQRALTVSRKLSRPSVWVS